MDVPERLTARVVAPGERPLLHGYDVQEDLSAHYGFGEVVLIALTGEAPSREAGRAFDAALTFASPVSVAEAPSHAAALSRLCSAKPSSVAGVAAIGLAEQARHRLDELEALLAWLREGRDGDAPTGVDDPGTARLHARLRAVGHPPDPRDAGLPLSAALVATLFDLGLHERWQLEAALAVARWPIAIAEAMSNRPGDLRTYPIRLPEFAITGDAE